MYEGASYAHTRLARISLVMVGGRCSGVGMAQAGRGKASENLMFVACLIRLIHAPQYPDYTIMRLSCSRRDVKIARCGIGVCRHRGPRAPRKHVVIDGVEKGLERFAFAPKLRALFVGGCYTGSESEYKAS